MNGRPFAHDRWNDPIPDLEEMISATECTGFIPAQDPDAMLSIPPWPPEGVRHKDGTDEERPAEKKNKS